MEPIDIGLWVTGGMLVMVVLGGQGTLWGPVLGAATITAIQEVLRPHADYDIVVYGLLLVVMMIVKPGGLSRALGALYGRLREHVARRRAGDAAR